MPRGGYERDIMDNETTASRNFLEDIIDADLAAGRHREIITRFPPEPNGYLHIGHAKSICLNFGLAAQYGGRCNLRYDDTNPTKEDVEYVESIERDIKWLGFEWNDKLYASDYFDFMYDCAETLIKKGLAFVCDLSADDIRAFRGTLTEPGKESPFRGRSAEENLDLFRRMRTGEFADGEKVLRAKIDMASPNLNMRDPVIYRISHTHHHRTGDQWCIYPMYDFAHPLEDVHEHITHSICTLEFEDHRPLYDWVVENCGVDCTPHQYEFARLGLTRTIMSKRYLKRLVDDGAVSGWDDPRMPTLSGMRRRGYTPSSIRDFCSRIGVSKANSTVDVRLLEHCVREELNETAPRVMGVLRPVKLVIENYPEDRTEMMTAEDLPRENSTVHEVPFSGELFIERDDFMPEAPNKKYFRLAVGKEVRLKNAYIIKCIGYEADENGNVTLIRCEYDPTSKSGMEGSNRKVKGTLHWVDAKTAIPAVVRIYDYLLDDDEESGRDFSERINENSLETLSSFLEPHIKTAKASDRFQYIRMGYFAADEKEFTPEKPVFNMIVGLKDSFSKTLK